MDSPITPGYPNELEEMIMRSEKLKDLLDEYQSAQKEYVAEKCARIENKYDIMITILERQDQKIQLLIQENESQDQKIQLLIQEKEMIKSVCLAGDLIYVLKYKTSDIKLSLKEMPQFIDLAYFLKDNRVGAGHPGLTHEFKNISWDGLLKYIELGYFIQRPVFTCK